MPASTFSILASCVGEGGADFFEGFDGAAVVALLEVAEADVVVGLVDLRGGREVLDDLPHDLEALSVVARLVEAGAGIQEGVGAQFVVRIGLGGGGLVVDPRLVVLALLLEKVIGQAQVGFEADRAARVALDDRLPDLERLFVLADLEAGVAGLQELAGGAILDDRSALDRGLGKGGWSRWRGGGGSEEKRVRAGHVLIRTVP